MKTLHVRVYMYSRTEELQVGKDAFNPTVPFDVGALSISIVVALRCVVGIGIRVPVMDALRVRRGKTKLKNSIVEHVIVKLYNLHVHVQTYTYAFAQHRYAQL